MTDGQLALRLFDELLPGPTWGPWRAFVAAVFGEADDDAMIRTCTGRTVAPVEAAAEVWMIAGRRSGKSRVAALLAVFFAAVKTHPRLVAGERGVVLVLAADRKQARVIFDYVFAMLEQAPALAALIEGKTTTEIRLTNGISIEIATSSSIATRGYTVVACLADEVAFWPTDDAAESDTEVLNAVRPAMATTGGLLVCLSSPYAARGELHRAYEKHYGRDGSPVLVWKAPTRTMNPTISAALIDRALADDYAAAEAEWLAEFRRDLETLFGREALAACVVAGRHELAPGTMAYTAFVDPSGGSNDAMTLAIAHRPVVGGPVLDLIREVHPPFSPEQVVKDFANDLRRYGLATVTGDAYAGEWVAEQFKKHRIDYVLSKLTRSELYLELLPLVNARDVAFLDHPRLIGQLSALQRRVGRSGRDSVDHRSGLHDDVANAVAGACVVAVRGAGLPALPPQDTCYRAETIGRSVNCYLWSGSRGFYPGGLADPSCNACPSHRAVCEMAEAAGKDPRTYWEERQHMKTPVASRGLNQLLTHHKHEQWSRNMDAAFNL